MDLWGREVKSIEFFGLQLFHAKDSKESWVGISWGSGYKCKGIVYHPRISFF